MSRHLPLARRQFLIGGAAASVALAMHRSIVLAQTQAGRFAVNVASNQAADNAALQQLMLDRGLLGQLSLDVQIVESRTVSGPMEALLAGDADVCMISAFVGVLPAIEHGKALRLIGAAMLLPALAVYARNQGLRRVGEPGGVGRRWPPRPPTCPPDP
jgi:NitT/TauT family transport system substrate-binding protein